MFYYNQIEETLDQVIHSLKVSLYNRDEDVFEKIDFENEEIYLEPLLFAYLNQKEDFWFDSITLSYQKKKKGDVIKVKTNDDGVVYLPNICYLITKKSSEFIDVEILEGNNFKLFFNKEEIQFEYEPLLFLKSGMEVVKYYHPLFDSVFREELKVKTEIKTKGVSSNHIENMNTALSIIKDNNENQYKALQKNVKKIMLYEGKRPYSFATLSIHNMIFLNTKKSDNEVFFVDHISHEGGHVLFNTVTFLTKNNMFQVPFHTEYSEVSGVEWEHGNVYSRFHGLFTFCEIATALGSCYENKSFDGHKYNELRGRLVFTLLKYGLQLEAFDKIEGLFTEEGKKWMEYFSEVFKSLEKIKLSLEDKIVFDDQPYDFDYEIFLKHNPLNS